jgi:CheY-like chemotaxis protein
VKSQPVTVADRPFAVIGPGLIVLDIVLPGLDGLERLTQLRRDSNLYVIMLTAKSEGKDKSGVGGTAGWLGVRPSRCVSPGAGRHRSPARTVGGSGEIPTTVDQTQP